MSERRNYRFIFRLNDDELKLIKYKMELFGVQNMSAYLRKMAIDGYVINLDIPEISELISLLRRASNNISFIAAITSSVLLNFWLRTYSFISSLGVFVIKKTPFQFGFFLTLILVCPEVFYSLLHKICGGLGFLASVHTLALLAKI